MVTGPVASHEQADQYRMRTVDDDHHWDSLVDESNQGNVFSSTSYLRALDTRFSRYAVVGDKNDILALAVIIEQGSAMHKAPFPFTPHQGILFCETLNALPSHRQLGKKQEITEFLIAQLIRRYGNFHMSLSPAFNDLRPFSWHNYHSANEPRFTITPRYTARLNLRGFDLNTYLSSIRTVRRQEYQKSLATARESDNIDAFMGMYVKNFERQDISVDKSTLELVRRIVTASLSEGFGRLCVAEVNGHPASMTLFLHDSRCAWYLFGANDPAWRKSGASAVLMIDNIRHYAERGLPFLDFVGVNSPQRGDYKLSFNGQLTPYFEVHLES